MKLNLGAGDFPLDGWLNVDLPEFDLCIFPWPWINGSVEAMNASHVLEHFDLTTIRCALAECRRILQAGGWLTVAAPDLDVFVDARLNGDESALNGYHWRDLNHLLGGDENEPRPEWRHRYMFSRASLWQELEWAGFVVADREFDLALDNVNYRGFSVYLEGVRA